MASSLPTGGNEFDFDALVTQLLKKKLPPKSEEEDCQINEDTGISDDFRQDLKLIYNAVNGSATSIAEAALIVSDHKGGKLESYTEFVERKGNKRAYKNKTAKRRIAPLDSCIATMNEEIINARTKKKPFNEKRFKQAWNESLELITGDNKLTL